jgi:UDP-N-acetylmuramoylalanine-D-glutamate ligase
MPEIRTDLADRLRSLQAALRRRLGRVELLAQMLNACGQRTIACGNIGKPLCEVALEQRDLDTLTVEVSSFQLETIRTFRPSISVWLNFAPDHLDRYRSIGEYPVYPVVFAVSDRTSRLVLALTIVIVIGAI